MEMKFKSKITGIIIVLLMLIPSITFASNQNDINVVVDGVSLNLDAGIKVKNDRVLLPFRELFNKLGAKDISWDDKNREIRAVINKKDLMINLHTNSVTVDKKNIDVDSKIMLENGITYIPVRLISEATGNFVQWIPSSKTVAIYTKDTEVVLENSKTKEVLSLNMTLDELVNIMGQPDRIDKTRHLYKDYIYNSKDNLDSYIQVGVYEDRIVSLKTNASNWSYGDIKVGNSKANINRKYKDRDIKKIRDKYDVFSTKNIDRIILFYDDLENKGISTIVIQNRLFRGQELDMNDEIIRAYEQQAFDLTNVYRKRDNQDAFEWSDKLANMARLHSIDMAENNYFNHTSKSGQTSKNRFENEFGLSNYAWGENIAMNSREVIFMMESLYNSRGHRDNILDDYREIGIGVYHKDNKTYLTENFLTNFNYD